MIDINYKPKYLPQISSPFNVVLKYFDDEKIPYKKTLLNPDTIKPSQGIVFLDKIQDYSDDYIWLSKDLKVLDGHHRYGSCLSYNKPIKGIIIMLPYLEAIRELNRIQDIINFKEKQENLITYPDEINVFDIIRDEYFYDENIYGGKKRKLIGYRNKPIKDDSKSGNFFSLQPIKGYNKYEIEMDNVLDTDDLDIVFENNINPVFKLAEYWFKGVDFDYLANKNDIPKNKLISRCVSELGYKYGFDGIKYGDIILQVLK
jgi:hypothetical protein